MKMIKHDEKNVEGLTLEIRSHWKGSSLEEWRGKNGNYLSLAYKERV